MKNKYKNLFSLLKALIIIIVIILIAKYRVWLTNDIYYDFNYFKQSDTDAGYFVYNALNFKNLNLSVYMPLIKNRAHMWFLVLSSMSGFNINFCIAFMWILSSILVYLVLVELRVNRIISMVMFVYVLFCPIAFFTIAGPYFYLYRHIVYIQLIIICFTTIILYDLSIINKKCPLVSIVFGTLASAGLVFVCFVDEVGIVYLLSSTLFTILFYLYYIFIHHIEFKYKIKNSLKQYVAIIKSHVKVLLLLIIPLIIYTMFYFGYKYFNYRIFDLAVINNRTEGEVAKFISLVQNIDSEDTSTFIWCSFDQLKKAEEVSETFDKEMLRKFLLYKDSFGNEKGIHGDFLGWACLWSIKDRESPKDQSEFFRKINDELENAYDKGLLKATKKIRLTKTSGHYTFEEIKDKVIPLTLLSISELINYDHLQNYIIIELDKNIDDSKKFLKFFNIEENSEEGINHTDDKMSIINKYKKYNKLPFIIFALNLVISVIVILLLIIRNNNTKYKKYFFEILFLNGVSIATFGLFVLYLFSISWFNVWFAENGDVYDFGLNHLAYYYGGRSLAFLFIMHIFVVAAFYKTILLLLRKIKISRLKKYLTLRWRTIWN